MFNPDEAACGIKLLNPSRGADKPRRRSVQSRLSFVKRPNSPAAPAGCLSAVKLENPRERGRGLAPSPLSRRLIKHREPWFAHSSAGYPTENGPGAEILNPEPILRDDSTNRNRSNRIYEYFR